MYSTSLSSPGSISPAMAHKRSKKRTHKAQKAEENDGIPKSMVIQTSAASSGKALSQLTKDTRLMMAPHTAARLKERKNNRLRDYTTMAGPLGVTHLLLFNQSTSGPTLRIARTPRGPTLFFRISEYSLSKDINKILRNPKSPGVEFQYGPLLVLSNFSSTTSKEHPEEELLRTTFQNMFPALNTNTAALNNMRRVVLLHRTTNALDAEIQVRHYAINTRAIGQDRKLRKIASGEKRKKTDRLPNLSNLSDVSQFILGPTGYDSASESEFEEDSKIEVPVAPTISKKIKAEEDLNNDSSKTHLMATQQRGVKLVELGPRMTLHLYKITAEVSSGQVMYHRDIHLSQAEIAKQQALHERLEKEKNERKAQQVRNIKRKLEEKEATGSRSKRGKLRARERAAAAATAEDGKAGDGKINDEELDEMSSGELEVEEQLLAESDSDDDQEEEIDTEDEKGK